MKFPKELLDRSQRAILGLVAKKFVAWYVATFLLVYKYIAGSEWVLLTVSVFALQIIQNNINGPANNWSFKADSKTSIKIKDEESE